MASSEDRPELPREYKPVGPEPGLSPDAPQAPPPEPAAPVGRPAFELSDVPRTVSLVTDSVITRPLAERMAAAGDDDQIGVVIEPRTDSGIPLDDVITELIADITLITKTPEPTTWRSGSYVGAALTTSQILALVAIDSGNGTRPKDDRQEAKTAPRSLINRIWPNFEVTATIHRTVVTTKSDAAVRAFDATGDGIVWAVLDTGIDAAHEHFKTYATLDLPKTLLPKSFVSGFPDDAALIDPNGHGTHVAGIIAGGREVPAHGKKISAASFYRTAGGATGVERILLDRISGMAPRTKILPIKVLNDDRIGDLASLLEALEYIQDLNRDGRDLKVHGVNLSLGYPFDPSWFATGLSPVCREVDRLVSNGVCVVVSAGNTGYGTAQDSTGRAMRLGFAMTINDPGNAARAITVGSTSIKPYSTGVSYFSSKGPTGDGRLKPDIVAPGERVLSAGAGALLDTARSTVEGENAEDITYVEDSGTSMAAPHVSGVAAAFLSVHREFIGRPDDVKRILMDSASDLGREPAFQGRGLVDAMRAIQSV
jgi:subtilisin family serine protease